jgi:hypothetical protein
MPQTQTSLLTDFTKTKSNSSGYFSQVIIFNNVQINIDAFNWQMRESGAEKK